MIGCVGKKRRFGRSANYAIMGQETEDAGRTQA